MAQLKIIENAAKDISFIFKPDQGMTEKPYLLDRLSRDPSLGLLAWYEANYADEHYYYTNFHPYISFEDYWQSIPDFQSALLAIQRLSHRLLRLREELLCPEIIVLDPAVILYERSTLSGPYFLALPFEHLAKDLDSMDEEWSEVSSRPAILKLAYFDSDGACSFLLSACEKLLKRADKPVELDELLEKNLLSHCYLGIDRFCDQIDNLIRYLSQRQIKRPIIGLRDLLEKFKIGKRI
ncbi:MAG: hypothetical protein Q4P72_06275 [Eubacteriales bacterium]|nr:hypothetical protein [Eubacteriales bacterium]